MTTQATAASAARHYDTAPQITAPGEQTWITRGANFVVCVSRLAAGTVLERPQQDDEYMVLTTDAAARIEAGDQHCNADRADSLTIVPPGASVVTALADGLRGTGFLPSRH